MEHAGGFDAAEPGVEALEFEGEGVVPDAEQVEHGGVEIVDGGDFVDGGVAEFVGGAIDEPALDSGAGQPHGHGFIVVIAAEGAFAALGHGGTAELAGPDDEGFLEHAALLEVADQGGAGAVDFGGAEREFLAELGVMVPIAVIELDEAGAAFGQAAGEQAIGGERAVAGLAAVHGEGFGTFVGEIHEAGHAGLHAEGHFVLGDPGVDFGVVDEGLVVAVELEDGLQVGFLSGA